MAIVSKEAKTLGDLIAALEEARDYFGEAIPVVMFGIEGRHRPLTLEVSAMQAQAGPGGSVIFGRYLGPDQLDVARPTHLEVTI